MAQELKKDDFVKAAAKSFSLAQMLRNLNRTPYGASNYKFVKAKIIEYGIDISHFTGARWNKGKKLGPKPRIPLNEILVKGRYFNTVNLKKRLINSGLKLCECEQCHNKEWNDKPIPLELHHINGDNTDNRIENLQILCPNCHAQTDTYCSKNKENKHLLQIKNKKTPTVVVKPATFCREKSGIKANDKLREKKKNEKVCPICGKVFYPKNKNQKYCSYGCSYKGRQKIKVTMTQNDMLLLFKELKSFRKVGEKLGVSDKCIVKRCKKMGLPFKIKGIKDLVSTLNNNKK